MRQYCTLFDKNYLFKGLALYRSLIRHAPESVLWILCMDSETYELLAKMQLTGVKLLKLSDVEDEELQRVKPGRTKAEYCWTLSSSLPLYILTKNPELEMMTYLDSDLYFYASPEPVYEEFGSASVVIIPHRYTAKLKHLEVESGIYNVGWITFRNNAEGLTALRWWRERVLEWCFARLEDGKFGDQLYLNDWPVRFKGVHALENPGANLAPWNIANYQITGDRQKVFADSKPLLFYHFQGLRIYSDLTFLPSSVDYEFPTRAIALVYEPHYNEIRAIVADIRKIDPQFNSGFTPKPAYLARFKKLIKNILKI